MTDPYASVKAHFGSPASGVLGLQRLAGATASSSTQAACARSGVNPIHT